ncbi:exosortase/archaeosortase family protein [Pedobacter sp. UYP24]
MKETSDTLRFVIKLLMFFIIFQCFIIAFIGFSTPGGIYIYWLDEQLNFIRLWRKLLIGCTASILKLAGYTITQHSKGLTVKGYAGFNIVYSCLGYGVTNALLAFIFAFPKSKHAKYYPLIMGAIYVQILNIIRLCLIAVYYKPEFRILGLGYHDIFNLFLYGFTIFGACLWIKHTSTN